MKSFKNIANLIRVKRMAHPEGYSQLDLSLILGYKNGQFVSNIERGLCNVPFKILKKIALTLDIKPEELKTAILQDHAETLDNYFNKTISYKEVKRKNPSEMAYVK